MSGGEVFDSSRTRGLEFTFTLGEGLDLRTRSAVQLRRAVTLNFPLGLVVAGWDEGVKTMKQVHTEASLIASVLNFSQ